MPLNDKGMEIPDPRSLVAVCDLKPITMGERIRRYVRTPQLRDDLLFDNDEYDPDDFHDDEDRPASPFEERTTAFMDRVKSRRQKKDEETKKAAQEALEAEEKAFSERVKNLIKDIPRSE